MEDNPAILYVEDDPTLGYVTQDNLIRRGYNVHLCDNGNDALSEYNKGIYNIIVLDIMLPKLDGISVARNIRRNDKEIPIIFLTAKSLLEDKLEGLSIGGDDYIIKPFSIEELVLKIDIFLKRSKIFEQKQLKGNTNVGKYIFDGNMLTLTIDNNVQKLTLREADLIAYFIKNKGKLVPRDEILNTVWGNDDYFVGRSLDVFISRLRKYFKHDPDIKIENRHGIGFVFSIK